MAQSPEQLFPLPVAILESRDGERGDASDVGNVEYGWPLKPAQGIPGTVLCCECGDNNCVKFIIL